MIGVYGGTFDPIHYGHLRTALEVRGKLGLSELRLIPSSQPPHRDQPTASAESRLEMLQLAVQDMPGFVIDTRELERKGASYMVDTLKSIRDEIGESPLLLITGTDAFENLTDWHQWQKLFDYAHFIVMSRPGSRHVIVEMDSFFQDRLTESKFDLEREGFGRLFFQEVTQLDISATQIRRLIIKKESPRFLLPDSIIEYIRQHRLYAG